MDILEKEKRLDYRIPADLALPSLSTEVLFTESRGQMFGVLVCSNPAADKESRIVLKAFSGQFNGIWEVDGWVPPILESKAFIRAVAIADPKIKELGAIIKRLPTGEKRNSLVEKRRIESQLHMREIHAMYTIRNFEGGTTDLFSLFENRSGIPAGTGDCCAPKLLNHAILLGLKPLGIAEFFWGRENRSGTKQHGLFYPPCTDKCLPILGYMLRGSSCS